MPYMEQDKWQEDGRERWGNPKDSTWTWTAPLPWNGRLPGGWRSGRAAELSPAGSGGFP